MKSRPQPDDPQMSEDEAQRVVARWLAIIVVAVFCFGAIKMALEYAA